MSAPPGWHPQPDGRERYWDGSQWTEQFRTPAPTDVTAPPPPSWASPEPTQAIDVNRTQAIAAPDPSGAPPSSGPVTGTDGAPGSVPQWQPPGDGPAGGYPVGAVPQPTGPVPPATGYGTPGTPWQPPPSKGRSRGCLIGAIVALVAVIVVVGLVIWGVLGVGRAVVDAVESAVPTALPTNFPSDFPTSLPTELPTDLPTDLPTAAAFDIKVGERFTLPRATVADGWALSETGNLGARVEGMRATFTDATQVPTIFTLSFAAGGETFETVCTSQGADNAGVEVEVNCVPILGDLSGVESVRVTPGF
ncbi:MAG: DUF2510 domain-containing protein [Dermatophilaceae bacterium]